MEPVRERRRKIIVFGKVKQGSLRTFINCIFVVCNIVWDKAQMYYCTLCMYYTILLGPCHSRGRSHFKICL